jgi:cyclic pyranopterin phosphate synthase
VKLNTVALAKDNQDELGRLMTFAHAEGHDIAFIETMPLGEIDEDRTDQFLSLRAVKDALSAIWTLTPASPPRFGGPSRLYEVAETGGRVGFITPLSDNFCAACNRVRLTCTGVLHTCLGHEDGVDLRSPLREGADNGPVTERILDALARKPERHDFAIGRGAPPTVHRHMSTTGG